MKFSKCPDKWGIIGMLLILAFAISVAIYEVRTTKGTVIVCDGGYRYRQSLNTGIKIPLSGKYGYQTCIGDEQPAMEIK